MANSGALLVVELTGDQVLLQNVTVIYNYDLFTHCVFSDLHNVSYCDSPKSLISNDATVKLSLFLKKTRQGVNKYILKHRHR